MYESAEQLSLRYDKVNSLNVLRLPNNNFGCTVKIIFVKTQQVSVALCVVGVKICMMTLSIKIRGRECVSNAS